MRAAPRNQQAVQEHNHRPVCPTYGHCAIKALYKCHGKKDRCDFLLDALSFVALRVSTPARWAADPSYQHVRVHMRRSTSANLLSRRRRCRVCMWA